MVKALFFGMLLFFSTQDRNGITTDRNGIPSRVLLSSSTKLLEVPSFGFYGLAQCDRDGNLFFHTTTETYNDPSVLKLSSGSWEPTIFRASDASEKIYFGEYSVSPSGEVHILGDDGALDGEQYVFAFDSDGKMSGKTKLDVPAGAFAEDFAVSDRGVTLLAGYSGPKAAPNLQGQSFVGLFQPSGKLLRRLNSALGTVDLADVGKSIHAGFAIFADDGFLYLLHEQSILVISESGTLVRRIMFDKPSKEAAPVKIAVSGGWIAIWLREADKKFQVTEKLLVIDGQTQEPFAIYTPPTGVKGGAMCFSRKDGFEFFGIQDGRVKITTAALR